jgi:hypothetical protein
VLNYINGAFGDMVKRLFDNKNVVLRNPKSRNAFLSLMSKEKALTIGDYCYTIMAKIGGDKTPVFEALIKLSKNDFNNVYNHFGLRWYNTVLGSESTNVLGSKFDFIQWLQSELEEEHFRDLDIKFKLIS